MQKQIYLYDRYKDQSLQNNFIEHTRLQIVI